MSPSSRRVSLALAATTALSIIGAALLIGGLGGNWLAFLALAAILLVSCFIAFVLMALVPSALAAAGISREMPDGPDLADDLFGDRDRWAS